MLNFNEELEGLKELLETGKIDKQTYDEEVARLNQKKENIKPNKIRALKASNMLLNILRVLIILVISVILIIFLIENSGGTREYEKLSNIDNLPDPIQTSTSKEVTTRVLGLETKLTYLAKYSITGRVVYINKHKEGNLIDRVCPIDLGISWGYLANKYNFKKLKWSSSPTSRVLFADPDSTLESGLGIDYINTHFSNNHIIPSTNEILNMIKSTKVNDFIRIDGYLVNIEVKASENGYYSMGTSLIRNDTGIGACETIYVTDYTWLKP